MIDQIRRGVSFGNIDRVVDDPPRGPHRDSNRREA